MKNTKTMSRYVSSFLFLFVSQVAVFNFSGNLALAEDTLGKKTDRAVKKAKKKARDAKKEVRDATGNGSVKEDIKDKARNVKDDLSK